MMPVHLRWDLVLQHLAVQVRPGKGRPLAGSGLGIPGRCGEEPRGTGGPGKTWPGCYSVERRLVGKEQRQRMSSEVGRGLEGLAVLAFKVSGRIVSTRSQLLQCNVGGSLWVNNLWMLDLPRVRQKGL